MEAAENIVYCFPEAGGGKHQYVGWANRFDGRIDWRPVEYAGQYSREFEAPVCRFEDVVEEFSEHIAAEWDGRPVSLFGHSLGAHVAFEVCRLLEAEGKVPMRMLFVSSAYAPSVMPATRERRFELSDVDLVSAVLAAEGDYDPSDDGAMRRLLLEESVDEIRNGMKLHYSYSPDRRSVASSSITAMCGTGEDLASAIGAWGGHTESGFFARTFVGGHDYWRNQSTAVVECLVEALDVLG